MHTLSFCQDFENGDDCESAEVYSWIPGGDDDDYTITQPSSYTPPPAPIYGGNGCCTGNSLRMWSFCGIMEDEAMCVEADECTRFPTEDEDVEECRPSTAMPTPETTLSPTHDTKGCCAGTAYDSHTWTFCRIR